MGTGACVRHPSSSLIKPRFARLFSFACIHILRYTYHTMKKYLYTFIFLAVIVGGGVLYVSSITWINDVRAKRAGTIGNKYLAKVYKEYKVLGEICQGVDTDKNGYVSCTFRVGKDNVEKEINLQCPTYIKSFLGNECKATQMVLPQ